MRQLFGSYQSIDTAIRFLEMSWLNCSVLRIKYILVLGKFTNKYSHKYASVYFYFASILFQYVSISLFVCFVVEYFESELIHFKFNRDCVWFYFALGRLSLYHIAPPPRWVGPGAARAATGPTQRSLSLSLSITSPAFFEIVSLSRLSQDTRQQTPSQRR